VRRWRAALAAAGAGLVLVLGGCTGGGGISIPTNIPTTFPTSITVTLPTVTTETRTTTETITRTGAPTTVTNTLTNTVTNTVTNTITSTVTNTVTAAPTPQPVATSAGLPPWAWVLLALLLIGIIALVVWLVRRAGGRAEWDDKMAQARRDANWLEDSLVQQVIDRGSTAEASRTWQAAQPRLIALDESLYSLSTTAPDEERTAQATQLRARVAGLVQAVGADTATPPDASGDDFRARRAAVWRARTELRQVLDAAAQRQH
jgi:hypothetical protein